MLSTQYNRTVCSAKTPKKDHKKNNQSSGIKQDYQLTCPRHSDRLIEKICTNANCENDIKLCAECCFEQQQHIGLHKDWIMPFPDFIDVCKSLSLKYRDDFGNAISNKQFNKLINDIDQQVMKYKTHIKKEEEKIDNDFDKLVRQFQSDIEDIKNKLKDNLHGNLDKFAELGTALRQKAHDLNKEKSSNQNYTNDFDEFLGNLKGAKNNSSINLKKLMSNIIPLINRAQQQYQKQILSTNNANLIQNRDQNDAMSCFTGQTFCTNLTLSLGGNSYLTPLKDAFYEFKELANTKPVYRNKGEANKIYRDGFTESRKVYYSLMEIMPDFIVGTKKVCEKSQKLERQSLDKEFDAFEPLEIHDIIELDKQQHISSLDHLKVHQTTHKGGIFTLNLIDDDTFVTGSNDRTLKVWRLSDLKMIKETKMPNDITSVCTLPRLDGSVMLLVGLWKQFAVLNQSYEICKIVEGEHESSINSIVSCKDGESVITASIDPKIVVWNIFNEEMHNRKYFDHRDTIYALEMFPNKDYLASGGRDRSIKIWRLIYYKEFRNGILERLMLDTSITNAHTTDITALKSSQLYPEILISGSTNGEIKIWETNDGTLLKSMKNYSGWVYKLMIFERPLEKKSSHNMNSIEDQENICSPRRMVSSSMKSKKTKIIKEAEKKPKTKISKYFENQLNHISFLSASFDGTMKVWEASKDVPTVTAKSENFLDCYPFGGMAVIKLEETNKIQLLSSGTKSDPNIHFWALK